MPSLPVFATIAKAFAFLGLNLRPLTVWTILPLGLTLAVFGLGALMAYLVKHWLPLVPCAILVLFVWGPYSVRVNQLIITGRPWEGGYLSRIFESPSVRYVGYSYLLMAIYILGLGLASMPAVVAGAGEAIGVAFSMKFLSVWISAGLALAFAIMIAPLSLICPAACVEEFPKLSKAYNLGTHVKARLFLAMILPHLLFAVLSSILDLAANALGVGQGVVQNLVLLPAQLILAFFGCIVNLAVPALAYRHLRGLPDPVQAEGRLEAPGAGPIA